MSALKAKRWVCVVAYTAFMASSANAVPLLFSYKTQINNLVSFTLDSNPAPRVHGGTPDPGPTFENVPYTYNGINGVANYLEFTSTMYYQNYDGSYCCGGGFYPVHAAGWAAWRQSGGIRYTPAPHPRRRFHRACSIPLPV